MQYVHEKPHFNNAHENPHFNKKKKKEDKQYNLL